MKDGWQQSYYSNIRKSFYWTMVSNAHQFILYCILFITNRKLIPYCHHTHTSSKNK